MNPRNFERRRTCQVRKESETKIKTVFIVLIQ